MGFVRFIGFFIVSLVGGIAIMDLTENHFIPGFILALVIGALGAED